MKNILPGIKWVFIDIGYTLVDEDDAVEDRIVQIQGVLEDAGIPVTCEEIRAILQEAATEQALSPISRAIAKLTDSEELRRRLKAGVTWRKDLEKPYPGARQVLSALSERYRLGIIANQPLGTVARLEKWGFSKFVSLCLPSAELGLSKPDLAIFEMAIERSGCEPEHAVMVSTTTSHLRSPLDGRRFASNKDSRRVKYPRTPSKYQTLKSGVCKKSSISCYEHPGHPPADFVRA